MINRPTSCPFLLRVLLPEPPRSLHRPSIIRIELCICFRAITSGTLFTNCRASMEWLAVTRCPCRLVSTCCGSTYAEKYARYVEFRLSPRRPQLLRSPLFLRLCTHGSAVSSSASPSLSRTALFSSPSNNQPNASHSFFFLFHFDA